MIPHTIHRVGQQSTAPPDLYSPLPYFAIRFPFRPPHPSPSSAFGATLSRGLFVSTSYWSTPVQCLPVPAPPAPIGKFPPSSSAPSLIASQRQRRPLPAHSRIPHTPRSNWPTPIQCYLVPAPPAPIGKSPPSSFTPSLIASQCRQRPLQIHSCTPHRSRFDWLTTIALATPESFPPYPGNPSARFVPYDVPH